MVGWMGQWLNRLLPPVDFPYRPRRRPELADASASRSPSSSSATVASGLPPALLSARGDLSRTS